MLKRCVSRFSTRGAVRHGGVLAVFRLSSAKIIDGQREHHLERRIQLGIDHQPVLLGSSLPRAERGRLLFKATAATAATDATNAADVQDMALSLRVFHRANQLMVELKAPGKGDIGTLRTWVSERMPTRAYSLRDSREGGTTTVRLIAEEGLSWEV